MKRLGLLASIALLAANSAFAADLTEPTVVPAEPALAPIESTDWSGLYVGGQAGYAWGDADYTYNTDGDYNAAAGDVANHKPDGVLGGVHLGYNWQSGSALLGIEASALLSGVGGKVVGPYGEMDRISTDIDWIATLTPRVGLAANDWLFYMKGGLAVADITARNEDVNFGIFDERSDTRAGWTAGIGIEKMVTSKISIGLEGNYFDFGSFGGGVQQSRYVDEPDVLAPSYSDHSIDTSVFNVMARASFKFAD